MCSSDSKSEATNLVSLWKLKCEIVGGWKVLFDSGRWMQCLLHGLTASGLAFHPHVTFKILINYLEGQRKFL